MRVALAPMAWGIFSYGFFYGGGREPATCISLIPLAIGLLRWFDTKDYKEWKAKRRDDE